LRDYLNVAVPYIYFYEGGGANSIAKLEGAWPDWAPLDPPLETGMKVVSSSFWWYRHYRRTIGQVLR